MESTKIMQNAATAEGALPPATQKRKKQARAGRIVGIVLSYVFLVLLTFSCLFPFLWMLLSSLKSVPEVVNTVTITFFPAVPQWSNYGKVFERIDILRGLLNTLIVEVGTIPACVFISGMSAFAFSKMDLPHKNVHLMIQLSALMIPYACVVLPLYRTYYSMNLTDTLWPLILPSLFGGVSMMFFFVQFQRSIPSAIFDAAKVDGAGYFMQYCMIMLPMMGPAVAAQIIFMFVGNWNDFFAPSLYLTTEKSMTLQVMLKGLSDSTSELPVAFAGAVMASVPLYIIYLFFQRYFIEGMAISGVKG